MRAFPYEHESKRRPLFHPGEPSSFSGDILEIGPGRGDFLLSESEAHPNLRFVAIEIKKRRYFKIAKRIDERGLTNILLIQGDARIVLPEFYGAGTFERIYVLFPDPWPKRRYTEMRLLGCEFLRVLVRVLRAEGELILGTDAQDYLEWVNKNVAEVPEFERMDLGLSGESLSTNWRPTSYEDRWRAEGRTIRFVSYRKKQRMTS
jgi:tRNA (guanine-N7-)-methyltransferase